MKHFKLFFIILLAITTEQMTAQDSPKLIYVGDPMCSWCYGIAEEITGLTVAFPTIKMEIIMGGLRAGGGEEWNKQFKEFLKHHWEEVSARSGQNFSYDILSTDNFDYDTEPACRAVVAAINIDSDKGLDFFRLTQIGFYLDNNDPKNSEYYESICDSLGIDYTRWKNLFLSAEMADETKRHFTDAQNMGVRSFPTVLLQYQGKLHMIASGYDTKGNMVKKVTDLLSN